jgi:hypothetical protein
MSLNYIYLQVFQVIQINDQLISMFLFLPKFINNFLNQLTGLIVKLCRYEI